MIRLGVRSSEEGDYMVRKAQFKDLVADIIVKKRAAPSHARRIWANPRTGSQFADIEDILNERPARDHLKKIRNLPKHKVRSRQDHPWD